MDSVHFRSFNNVCPRSSNWSGERPCSGCERAAQPTEAAMTTKTNTNERVLIIYLRKFIFLCSGVHYPLRAGFNLTAFLRGTMASGDCHHFLNAPFRPCAE